ncbi:hypothetical protein [Hydrogenophaga pseudoflava]|uniref:hypothetical protein n=1 Tax=Hydrogenophaga pseudoflava TaxID=47421 RepID=UPI0027E477D1|nr:hypothetical protein [Hydrogenophaga pseudoflava]MDQ7746084.1 hypothetical protein [Hydrogenophaga pseudoflava]
MLYALSKDDRTLHVFACETDALAYCEGYDVASGNWQFFAVDGSPLNAVFTEPASKSTFVVTHGRYFLVPGTGASLADQLAIVVAVEGPPELCSPADVASALTRRSSRPPSAAAELKH